MLKLSKSRLLKSIPLVGGVLLLAIIIALIWFDFPAEQGQIFASYPALLLLLVALGFIRLRTAVLVQCVIVGAWWQFGIQPYTWVIVGALVGLKLGEWVDAQWKSAIERAKAEETFATLSVGKAGDAEQATVSEPQGTTEETSPIDRV